MSLTPFERALLRQRIDEARRAQQREPGPGERRCYECSSVKPLDAFSKAPKKREGRSSQCKECKAAYERDRKRRTRAAA